MTMSDLQPGRLVALGEDECWRLLRTRSVGRIAWSGSEGVSVVPVNFTVDGDAIVLRTTPYSQLARDCAGRVVAFEVDEIDVERHTGWSVVLRGPCERGDRMVPGPVPWATGRRVLGLRITVQAVSGRRIVAAAAP